MENKMVIDTSNGRENLHRALDVMFNEGLDNILIRYEDCGVYVIEGTKTEYGEYFCLWDEETNKPASEVEEDRQRKHWMAELNIEDTPWGIIEHCTKPLEAKWDINCDGYYLECSNCHNEPINGEPEEICPHCGAKMTNCEERKKKEWLNER